VRKAQGTITLHGGAPSFFALDGRKLDEVQANAAASARVVFCHFAIAPTWAQLFLSMRVGTFVIDEVHLPQSGMQSRKSITGNALRMLNAAARRSVFLSGSPLWSKPKGLWHILDMLNPGAWGDFWTYARRYCDAKPTGYGWKADGSSNEEELQTRLREVMLRRTWRDVAGSLPPINRAIEVVGISDAVRDRVEETAARIRSGGAGASQTVVGDLARLRKLYAHEKAHAAMIKAREAAQEGRSVIVWTWHRDVAEELAVNIAAAGGDAMCCQIDGDTSPTEREEIIETLRSVAQTRPVCLVATMGALATAVNLAFAEEEIFAELDWNPDSIAQAEMRCYDGTCPIRVTYLVADCDVDQKLADALISKFDVKDRLGVAPGVGSVADVLRESIGIEEARTLDALAAAVLSELNDVG
jgi:SNF2 family DNA or RNA helicase